MQSCSHDIFRIISIYFFISELYSYRNFIKSIINSKYYNDTSIKNNKFINHINFILKMLNLNAKTKKCENKFISSNKNKTNYQNNNDTYLFDLQH